MKNKCFEDINKIKQKVELDLGNSIFPNVKKTKIKGVEGDYIYKVSDTPKALGSIASAKMYNHIGIATPPVKQIVTKKDRFGDTTETIQSDVTKIENMEVCLAKDDVEYSKISNHFWSKYKWEVFENLELQEKMLQFMTLECLTQLKNLFLIDELRTDSDRTTKNYFLVKNIASPKYQSVVAVDLENMLLYDYCVAGGKDAFKNFILYSYASATPQQNEDLLTYKQRVIDLKELIQSGNLTDANIEALKGALSFDFPKEVKNESKKRKLKGKNYLLVVDPVAQLWEYNNDQLGKDIGL